MPTVKQEAKPMHCYAAKVVIKEEVAACEMENTEVKFYDATSRDRIPWMKTTEGCSLSSILPFSRVEVDFLRS